MCSGGRRDESAKSANSLTTAATAGFSQSPKPLATIRSRQSVGCTALTHSRTYACAGLPQTLARRFAPRVNVPIVALHTYVHGRSGRACMRSA